MRPANGRRAETEDKRRRDRLYNLGALAQSYVPRGVADLLNLSAEGRARARAEWRARPRRERVLPVAVIAAELACMGVLVWGVASRDRALVLAGAGAIVATFIASTALGIALEIRRSKDGRDDDQR